MSTYQVHAFQTVLEEAVFTINAETEAEAEVAALVLIRKGEGAWSFVETEGDAEIVGVRKI